MKTLIAIVVAALAAPLSAQWLNYPTPGVPKAANGQPNLSAPVPKTADGKPDFSGIWRVERGRVADGPPCLTRGCQELRTGDQWLDFGAGLSGGLPYQPWAADAKKQRMDQEGKDDPTSWCLPLGVPRLLVSPELMKIVQTPGLMVILNERNAGFRQVFTDGRPLPEDPQPTWNGYSTAKWEGDTLVVQTNGLRDGIWLDRYGSPITDSAKVTERFRRTNYGSLEIGVTVDDPKAYTKPWTAKVTERIVLNTELMDYICAENEKDMKTHMVGK
jgi:hypothetical protein